MALCLKCGSHHSVLQGCGPIGDFEPVTKLEGCSRCMERDVEDRLKRQKKADYMRPYMREYNKRAR